MVIKATRDNSYGKNRIVVINKDQREAISLLTGRDSLVVNDKLGINHIQGLKKLGHTVEVIEPIVIER